VSRGPDAPSGSRPSRLVILTGLDVRAYRGGEKWAASLGRELSARGVEVRLLSKVDPNEPYRLDLEALPAVLGLPVEFYRLLWVPIAPPLPLDPRRLLRALAWADSVYMMETTPRFVALMVVLCRALGKRIVLGLHHPTLVDDLAAEVETRGRRRWGTLLYRQVLRSADAVHVLNAHQATTLARIGVGDNVTMVHNYAIVPPGPVPPSGATTFEALFVGPLEREQKGIDLLVEGARRVLVAGADVHLTVVGTGRDVALVQRLVEEFPGRVRYLGFVSEEELLRLYAEAHVLWMTSRAEAFPAVMMEAFTHGIPVVGFAVPGLEDLSAVYPEGRVPPFDTEAFASRVLELHRLWRDDPASYDRLREHCRAAAVALFGVDVQLPKLAEVLGVRLVTAGGA